jgi:hypothetical protein
MRIATEYHLPAYQNPLDTISSKEIRLPRISEGKIESMMRMIKSTKEKMSQHLCLSN